jgi:hypothetical protein
MPLFQDIEVPLEKLLLDPNNYRFRDDSEFRLIAEKRFAEDSVQKKAQIRLRAESLVELKNSILTNGFLPVERIVVRKFPHEKDKYVVLEGNRRVAALKWIEEDDKTGIDVATRVLAVLKKVPILCIENEGDEPGVYEAIMGVRHVSGVKEWGGYQRAQLITEMRDTHKLEPQVVAERLGMAVREVNRRYKAYKALVQMQEDDEFGGHAGAKLYPIFHEAVALPKVREWLKWEDEKCMFQNAAELAHFYEWLTPGVEDGESLEPKISSHRDVRELPAVIADPEAFTVLKDPSKNFSDAVAIAKREEVAKAWKGQVAGATSALKSISAIELVLLAKDDLHLLKELKRAVDTTLDSYEKLVK